MDPTQNEPISSPSSTTTENTQAASTEKESSAADKPSILSWTKSLRISSSKPEDSQQGSNLKSTFSRFTGGFNLRSSPSSATSDESLEGKDASNAVQQGVFGSITRGIVDSSKSAVKAVQVKARHIVSQNKRRYQVFTVYKYSWALCVIYVLVFIIHIIIIYLMSQQTNDSSGDYLYSV